MRDFEARAAVDAWCAPLGITEASDPGLGGIKTAAGRGTIAKVFDPLDRGVAVGTWFKGPGVNGHGLALRIWRDDAVSKAEVRRLLNSYPVLDIQMTGRLQGPRPVPLISWQPSALQQRQRPLYPGVSVAHHAVTAGTLGAFVKRDNDDAIYILSNNHVLANVNTIDTPDRSSVGDCILQPGAHDGGTISDEDCIGYLAEFHPMKRYRETLDAALAIVNPPPPSTPYFDRYPGLTGNVRVAGTTPAVQGQRVWKVGRTTGKTWGTVNSTCVSGWPVEYKDAKVAVSFVEQIEVLGDGEEFSQGGDSGSLVLDEHNRAVGLLFAGEAPSPKRPFGYTLMHPIDTVLARFNARFIRYKRS
jgi:hypothetical protein